MIELVKDNYMTSSGNGPSWKVNIQPPNKKIKSYFEETLEVAEYIYANKTGRLHLLYSGGLDSEYVFNVFLKLGFDFTPVIIKLSNYNQHDLKYAFDFCESKNIRPTVIDIDFDEFVKSGKILDIAQSIKCGGYQIPATMYASSMIDGFVVLGDAPPYLKPRDDIWQLVEHELVHSILTYFKKYSLNGCPFILNYTAEQFLSFLLEPRMFELANNQHPGKLGNNTSKIFVYNNGTDFNMLQRTKYTGYENIEKSDIFQHENLKIFSELEKQWGGIYYEDYHPLVERLLCKQ